MGHLSLITNSKMTMKNIVREVLSAHVLVSNYIHHGNIKSFLEFRAIFQLLTMTVINLSYLLSTLASSLSWVTAQHRNRASTELVSVIQGNHLSREASCSHWWVIFAVSSNIAVRNIFDRHTAGVAVHNVPHNITAPDFILVVTLTGRKVSTMPGLRVPVFSLPTGKVPILSAFTKPWERCMQRLANQPSWMQGAIYSLEQYASTSTDVFMGHFPSLEQRNFSTWLYNFNQQSEQMLLCVPLKP